LLLPLPVQEQLGREPQLAVLPVAITVVGWLELYLLQ
jgi:hypothetical protein